VWGQIVGRTRAVAEYDGAIVTSGPISAFGIDYNISPTTLRKLKSFFDSLPDDRGTATI
jgi:hypothetical protein